MNSTISAAMGRLQSFTMAAMLVVAAPAMSQAHEIKAGDILIRHPWSREAPDTANVASGYVIIQNNGSTPDKLLSITGEIAGKTEIHSMSVDANGVMTMRQIADGIEIPAGGMVELKPGANHIMFMQLTAHPKGGRKFKGSMTFEKAGTINFDFHVLKGEPEADHHMDHGG